MRRLLILALLAGLAGPAQSATLAEAVVAELVAKGYSDVGITRTWLGRIVITAERDGRTREITLNPKTGEILRDYFRSRAVVAESSSSTGSPGPASGRDAKPDDTVRSTAAEDAAGGDGTVSPASEGTESGVLLDSVAEGSGE